MPERVFSDEHVRFVAQVRTAVSLAIEATSLRGVAMQIGVSPGGLKKFAGGAIPYSPTWRSLTRWYGEWSRRQREPDWEAVELAIEVFARDHHHPAMREALRQELRQLVRGWYPQRSAALPVAA